MKKASLIMTVMLSLAVVSQAERKRGGGPGRDNGLNSGRGDKIACGECHGGCPDGKKGVMSILCHPEIAEQAGISEKKVAAIKEKKENYEKVNRELRKKMREAAMKQARLLTAKDINEEELMGIVEELGEYRTRMAKERMKLIIFMRKNITTEQMEEVRKVMRKKMARGHGRHGRGEGRREGHGAFGRGSSERPQPPKADIPAE